MLAKDLYPNKCIVSGDLQQIFTAFRHNTEKKLILRAKFVFNVMLSISDLIDSFVFVLIEPK